MIRTTPWPSPDHRPLENAAVHLGPVTNADRDGLYEAARVDVNGDLFRYHVNTPPMGDRATFDRYLDGRLSHANEVLYRVFSKRLGKPVGCASLLNIQPLHGTVEVGAIWISRQAQRTEIHTNAMLLLFTHVFDDLGYRRLEWKCNALNEASRVAALRLGFEYEGRFRQHLVSRGENRDTLWFSLVDGEWPEKRARLNAMAMPRG